MILRILVCILVFNTLSARAQVRPDTTATDSSRLRRAAQHPVPVIAADSFYTAPGGIRVGIDISRFGYLYFQPYRREIVIVGDARLTKSMYAAIETGWSNTSHSDTNYTYKGNGAFATIGIDYNLLKGQAAQERHMVYAGIRYGFARLSYEVPEYTIHSPYWGGTLPGSVPGTSMSAHWVELTIGIRTEVLKNLFLGWSLRERILVSNSASDSFKPIVIPGYGSGAKKSIFDMQYTITYALPIWNIKVRVPKPKTYNTKK